MSRIKSRQTVVAVPAETPAPLRVLPPYDQRGRGRFADAWPLTPDGDVAAIKRAERWRDRELGDIPF